MIADAPSRAVNVIYALLTKDADAKAKAKLDRELDAPAEGKMAELWEEFADSDALAQARQRLRAFQTSRAGTGAG